MAKKNHSAAPKKNADKKTKTTDSKKKTTTSGKTDAKKDKVKGPQKIEKMKVEEYQAITVELSISSEELVEKSKEMIQLIKVKEQHQADLKAYQSEKKGEIASIDKKIKDLENIISTGKKKTPVQAGRVRNFMTTEVLLIRADADPNNLKPEDIYKKEPFTEWDYQLKIEMEGGNKAELKSGTTMFNSMTETHVVDEDKDVHTEGPGPDDHKLNIAAAEEEDDK